MFRQQFTGELVLTPLADGRRWRVREDFSYVTDAGLIITINRGRITDLASVPRFLWWLFPPFGRYTRAAVIHDFLYDEHRRRRTRYSRMYADAIFWEAMGDCGVARLPRFILWLGVRLGGWSAWNAKP